MSYQATLFLLLSECCLPLLAGNNFYLSGSQRINALSALWHFHALMNINRYGVNVSDNMVEWQL